MTIIIVRLVYHVQMCKVDTGKNNRMYSFILLEMIHRHYTCMCVKYTIEICVIDEKLHCMGP